MRAGQREGRAVVVKRCACPRGRGVARVAGGRESRRGVSRIGGPVPIRQVATVAGGGQRAVISAGAGVALNALHCGVEARQRERRRGVIEGRGCPVSRRVADRAIGREACGHVCRVCRPGEIRLMARVTCRRR